MPYQYGSSASSAAPTETLETPSTKGLEPLTTYPNRSYYFHVDIVDLLEAFLARETTNFNAFREEFQARKFGYICEMHPKEAPQDVISVLVDVIYNIARHSRYSLGCVYLLYLVYYSQEANARYYFPICHKDLRLLNDLARKFSPRNPLVGKMFNKLVGDDAFAVSAKKCPVTAYFSGTGFYYRIKRIDALEAQTQPPGVRCSTNGGTLIGQNGDVLIDFDTLAPRVSAQSTRSQNVYQSVRTRFEEFKKYRKPAAMPPNAIVALKKPRQRVKKKEISSARPNSERLGVRAVLDRVCEPEMSQVVLYSRQRQTEERQRNAKPKTKAKPKGTAEAKGSAKAKAKAKSNATAKAKAKAKAQAKAQAKAKVTDAVSAVVTAEELLNTANALATAKEAASALKTAKALAKAKATAMAKANAGANRKAMTQPKAIAGPKPRQNPKARPVTQIQSQSKERAPKAKVKAKRK